MTFTLQFATQSEIVILISSELTAVGNDNGLLRFVVSVTLGSLHRVEDLQTRGNLAEDDVGTVQMGSSDEAQEELRAVGAWTCVGH